MTGQSANSLEVYMCPLVSAANRDRYLEDRREQILEAAIKVFGKEGYSRANVADIAREAEIGKGTVYLYFKSKDEIFTSIMLERSPVLHLADCLSDLDAPIENVFRELAGTILNSLQDVLPLFHLAIADFQRFPEEAEHAYTQLYMLGITTMADYLQRKMERGDIRTLEQPRLTAQAFISMLHSFVIAQEFTGGKRVNPISNEQWIEEVVQFMGARLRRE